MATQSAVPLSAPHKGCWVAFQPIRLFVPTAPNGGDGPHVLCLVWESRVALHYHCLRTLLIKAKPQVGKPLISRPSPANTLRSVSLVEGASKKVAWPSLFRRSCELDEISTQGKRSCLAYKICALLPPTASDITHLFQPHPSEGWTRRAGVILENRVAWQHQ